MTTHMLDKIGLVYVVVLGACLGSFVNVLIARLPLELSIIRPRSRCPQCDTPIAWRDNVPIFAYLILRGRCRHCREPIAPRYLLVELLMAGLAAAFYVRFGLTWDLLIWLPLTAALLAIMFLDIDHWWVPDKISFPAMTYVAAASFLPGGLEPIEAAAGLVPSAMLFLLAWVFERITKRSGLGLGDVKLLAVLGLAVGFANGISVLLLAALQGSILGVLVVLTGGHQGIADNAEPNDEQSAATDVAAADVAASESRDGDEDEDDWVPPPRAIPFGPFLVLATLEVVLLPNIFGNLHYRMADAALRLLW